MYSACKIVALLVAACVATAWAAELRVCSAADGLPYSNSRGEGFENQLAAIVARDLDRTVRYVWLGAKPNELAKNVANGSCDLAAGVASSVPFLTATNPYYRSAYVWVSRRDRNMQIRSLDDPVLRKLIIGAHYLGEDNSEIPPVRALGKRGLMKNVAGFRIQGDFAKQDQAGELILAVVKGTVDVAMVWGPLGGYFAGRAPVPMDVRPIEPDQDGPLLPFSFDISMGVRRGNTELRDAINAILDRRRSEIRELLVRYHVPLSGPRAPAVSLRH